MHGIDLVLNHAQDMAQNLVLTLMFVGSVGAVAWAVKKVEPFLSDAERSTLIAISVCMIAIEGLKLAALAAGFG